VSFGDEVDALAEPVRNIWDLTRSRDVSAATRVDRDDALAVEKRMKDKQLGNADDSGSLPYLCACLLF
jgi:hypothetical protein